MGRRSLLLAIGIALVLSLSGNQFELLVSRAAGVVPDLAAADNQAARFGKALQGIVREVTAYNVGVKEQTSDTPCIGAGGRDLCTLVKEGMKVCAANFVELGTVLEIEEYGPCVVLDRLNRRYAHRVDIAMSEHEVQEALEFGLQKRLVRVKHRVAEIR